MPEITGVGAGFVMLISSKPTVAVAFVLTVLGANSANAQNCKAMPPGPERKACSIKYHPEAYAAKYAHCAQLAQERGFGTAVKFDPKKAFMKRCMSGLQN